jgi:peptide/nickel transport system substrate-binding protein
VNIHDDLRRRSRRPASTDASRRPPFSGRRQHESEPGPGAAAAAEQPPGDDLITRRVLAQHGIYGLLAFGAAGVLSACGGASNAGQTTGGAAYAGGGKQIANLDWILPLEPVTFDFPLAADGGSLSVMPNVLDTVFTFDDASTLKPALATGHQIVDPLTIVLSIRDGVRFHDGSPLTAEDVAYSLSRHLDPKVGSYWAQYYANVKSFEATGPLEVTIKLTKPDAGIVPTLGSLAGFVGSKAFTEKHGRKTGTAAVGVIGTGAYRFVSWRHGRQVVLERFEDHWNKDHVPFKVVRFTGHILTDVSTQVQSLRAGEMDGLPSVTGGRQLRQLLQDPQLTSVDVSYPAAVSLVLNVAKPPFDDVRVRHAMAYAIDRRGLLASVQGGLGTLVKSVAPPSSWGYERDTFQAAYDALEGYDYDLAKAKQLVAAAGAQGAGGELWALPTSKDVVEALQSAGNEAGLNLTVRIVDIAQFTQEAASPRRSYAGLLTLYSALYPDPGSLLSDCYTTGSNANAAGYSNPQLDAKLKLQRTLTDDPARRAQLLIEVQRAVTEASSFIPLWTFDSPAVLKKTIGGYPTNPYIGNFIQDLSGR